MNKKYITNITLSITILLIITIGLSFAYFTANISGSETNTTITTASGTMNIVYNGGAIIKCITKNDRFTTNDIILGNGNLDYSIGLLTVVETCLAGLYPYAYNSNNYLYNNRPWATLSPYDFSLSEPELYANKWSVEAGSDLSERYGVINILDVRGVINLKASTKVSGTGTTNDPFVVT